MKKQIIKLTETDLHNIIANAVNDIIKEEGEASMGATNCAGMTGDLNAAGYQPVASGIINRKFQKPAMSKNKNGSISIPDKKK